MIKHRRQEILLAEYQAAQSSAEHHDKLVWTLTSIVWGGSLALMRSILKDSMTTLDVVGSIILCVLGLLLTVFVWDCQGEFRRWKIQKYYRCQEIEEILGMKHHLAFKGKEGSQTKAYDGIMTVFFFAWLIVALSVLWNWAPGNILISLALMMLFL